MTKDDVLAYIAASDDAEALAALEVATKDRRKAIHKAAYDRAIDEYWKKVVWLKDGQTVYCCAAGTFIGGEIQRGTKGVVVSTRLEGRNPAIWARIGKRTFGFPKREAYRYRWEAKPPENPISPEMRQMAERLGRVLP